MGLDVHADGLPTLREGLCHGHGVCAVRRRHPALRPPPSHRPHSEPTVPDHSGRDRGPHSGRTGAAAAGRCRCVAAAEERRGRRREGRMRRSCDVRAIPTLPRGNGGRNASHATRPVTHPRRPARPRRQHRTRAQRRRHRLRQLLDLVGGVDHDADRLAATTGIPSLVWGAPYGAAQSLLSAPPSTLQCHGHAEVNIDIGCGDRAVLRLRSDALRGLGACTARGWLFELWRVCARSQGCRGTRPRRAGWSSSAGAFWGCGAASCRHDPVGLPLGGVAVRRVPVVRRLGVGRPRSSPRMATRGVRRW